MSEKRLKKIREVLDFYSNEDKWELDNYGNWHLTADPQRYTARAKSALYHLEKLEARFKNGVLVNRKKLLMVWEYYVVESPDGILRSPKHPKLWKAELAVGEAIGATRWRAKPSFWKDRAMGSSKFEDWWAHSDPQVLDQIFNHGDSEGVVCGVGLGRTASFVIFFHPPSNHILHFKSQ